MKLLHAEIAAFGKFYRRSFSFQDGIHVIDGPNEAGKSTLHAFIGAMLFGLERSRGKAARTDLYSRYLPWEHDGIYGGSLSFESGDRIYTGERSLRSDKKSCYLTAEGQGRSLCGGGLPEGVLEGLTEPIFQNTISIRQLRAAPDASLAGQLAQSFSDIRSGGSPSIQADRALARLRAEKRQKEALLDPSLDSSIRRLKEEKQRLEAILADASFRGRKERLEEEIENCLNQLDSETDSGVEGSREYENDGSSSASRSRRFPRLSGVICSVLLLAAAVLCFAEELFLPAAASGLAAAAVLLWAALRRPKREELPMKKASGRNTSGGNNSGGNTSGGDEKKRREVYQKREALRLRLKESRRLYEEASRQEWNWEQALEKLRAAEDELAALEEKAAAQDKVRLDIQAIALAMTTLARLAERQASSLGPRLDSSLSQILSGLTGGAYRELSIDDSLNLFVRADGRTVPASSLSQGTLEQIWLALRLAAVDVIFPQGGMPLLLDDCFLAYDDERLAHSLRWLAENYSGQVFIFTCQKREAALLQKERIPFTHIAL